MNTGYIAVEEEWSEVKEPSLLYNNINQVTYTIIGCCFEVHKTLGKGFLENVYKEALEYEFKKKNLRYEREKKHIIHYKEIVLESNYKSVFIIEDSVIFEVKAQQGIIETHFKQVINYLAATRSDYALLVNFGEDSLKYKRIILTPHNNPR
jgi:GxxExxY protein